MKIDCELTPEERDALCMLMGLGQGAAMQFQLHELAKTSLRVMNKLLQHSPDYTPYDEASFDPAKTFPFKRVTRQ